MVACLAMAHHATAASGLFWVSRGGGEGLGLVLEVLAWLLVCGMRRRPELAWVYTAHCGSNARTTHRRFGGWTARWPWWTRPTFTWHVLCSVTFAARALDPGSRSH